MSGTISLVIVGHDLPLILAISDRPYCLEAGEVIAEGAPTEIRSNPLVIASYLGPDERAIARSNADTETVGDARPREA